MHEAEHANGELRADARPGQARRAKRKCKRNGPFRGRNYLNYRINGGWSFFIGQFSLGRTSFKHGRGGGVVGSGTASYTRTKHLRARSFRASQRAENAATFLISYCVLTCHTCDHAMQYRGLEFLFSAPLSPAALRHAASSPPVPPQGPGCVGVGSCAFQIMRIPRAQTAARDASITPGHVIDKPPRVQVLIRDPVSCSSPLFECFSLVYR